MGMFATFRNDELDAVRMADEWDIQNVKLSIKTLHPVYQFGLRPEAGAVRGSNAVASGSICSNREPGRESIHTRSNSSYQVTVGVNILRYGI